MLIDVVSVKPRLDFQLDLEFKNGERRRFDMRPLWNLSLGTVLLSCRCLNV